MKQLISGAEVPRRARIGDAGYDFFAPCDFSIMPGQWTDVDTGVCFDGTEQPYTEAEFIGLGSVRIFWKDWYFQVQPRSGTGFKYKVRLANTVGIIDQSYRQSIKARFTSEVPIEFHKGDRIMQGIFVPCGILTGEIAPNELRDGGCGSTDKHA